MMRWSLEQTVTDRARWWWEQPPPRPEVTPREAATVVLCRPSSGPDPGPGSSEPDGQFDVFVLDRHTSMEFAAGMVVFPGGGRDPGDGSPALTGLRELFEESGVLLATDDTGAFPDTGSGEWEARRLAVVQRRAAFGDVLAETGLRPRTDLLQPWARWITPRFLPRRYDTWFFIAVLPPGQQARHVEGEAVESGWVTPQRLLAEAALMHPTRCTLHELTTARTLERVMAATRSMVPQLSELVDVEGELMLEHRPPDDLPAPPEESR